MEDLKFPEWNTLKELVLDNRLEEIEELLGASLEIVMSDRDFELIASRWVRIIQSLIMKNPIGSGEILLGLVNNSFLFGMSYAQSHIDLKETFGNTLDNLDRLNPGGDYGEEE